jgi:hypothetical protein
MIRQSVSDLAIGSCAFFNLERDRMQNRLPLLLIALPQTGLLLPENALKCASSWLQSAG